MAKETKAVAKGAAAGKKPDGGQMGFIIALILLSLISGGGGFFFSSQFLQPPTGKENVTEAEDSSEAAPDAHGKSSAKKDPHAKSAAKPLPTGDLITVPPIITNLAAPSGAYLRLEGAILVEPGYADGALLAARVSEDIVALLKTVQLSQLQGAAGIGYLREDINDRLKIRSEGKATEFIITSLVIE